MHGFVDLHCHLCAGLDDGPRCEDDALEMCRIAWEEGTRAIAALAHQNESWPDVTPGQIRESVARLRQQLAQLDVPLELFPSAEVMVRPGLEEAWDRGELLSLGDGRRYLLIELPGALVLDLRELIEGLCRRGVRPVLAHPERHPELLHAPGMLQEWISLGCVVQVSSGSVTDGLRGSDLGVLKRWVQSGMVHVLGSDGHSPRRRAPRMAAAYERLAEWAGPAAARQICISNGWAVLRGDPVVTPVAQPPKRGFFQRFFGS